MTVSFQCQLVFSFILLQDFKDSWFYFVTRFQQWSVLFRYEISLKSHNRTKPTDTENLPSLRSCDPAKPAVIEIS